jgi:hypothetical protein
MTFESIAAGMLPRASGSAIDAIGGRVRQRSPSSPLAPA